MSRLIFDETLLEGSTEERVAKALALLNAGCIILRRSITTVARGRLTTDTRQLEGIVPAEKLQQLKETSPTNEEFIQWCYGQIGIHLSPVGHSQRNGMRKNVPWFEANPSDLICFTLPRDPKRYLNGIVTDQRTVIYAGKRRLGVVEQTFESLQTAELIGIRKMLPPPMQRKTDVIRLPDRPQNKPQLEPTKETVRRLIEANLPKADTPPSEASAA